MEMKKILLGLAIVSMVALTGCSKETTYTFTNNMDWDDMSSYITDMDIYLSEYDATGSCVANNTISFPELGKAYEFVANGRAEKIKVYIKVKLQYAGSTSNWNRWVQQVYYLEEGKNIDIVITGEIIVGTSEP